MKPKRILVFVALIISMASAFAQSPAKDEWADWKVLLGNWVGTDGSGAPGKASAGGCSFATDLQGKVIVRKNHAEYPAANGRPTIVHDDLMIIFRRGSTVRAAYYDSEGHEINYAATYNATDKTWIFVSDPAAGTPRYRLVYTQTSPGELKLKFETAPPNSPEAFKTYIEATLKREK